MPRYSSDPVAWPGTEMVPNWPVRVFDGNGIEIDRCCVVDTDTGEVVVEVFDSKGRLVADWVKGEAVTVTASWFVPLPVRLEPVRAEDMVTVTVPLLQWAALPDGGVKFAWNEPAADTPHVVGGE